MVFPLCITNNGISVSRSDSAANPASDTKIYNSDSLDAPHETQYLAKQAPLDSITGIPIYFVTRLTDAGKQLSLTQPDAISSQPIVNAPNARAHCSEVLESLAASPLLLPGILES